MSTDPLIARNPSTGLELGHYPSTPPGDVAGMTDRARVAQGRWASTPRETRTQVLRRWWALLARDADDWAVAIRDEIGKPTGEGMAEVVSTLDAVRWTIRNTARALALGTRRSASAPRP